MEKSVCVQRKQHKDMGELIYYHQNHTYYHNNIIIPSVTQLLKEFGLINSYGKQYHLDLGQAVHLACRYLDENRLDWNTVDPIVLPYVESYQAFIKDTGFVSEKIESQEHNDIYNFACTIDRQGMLSGGRVLIELKTGSPQAWHGLQLVGQNLCLSIKIRERYVLELKNTGEYQLHPFTDRTDESVIIACAIIWHWRRNHGNYNIRE